MHPFLLFSSLLGQRCIDYHPNFCYDSAELAVPVDDSMAGYCYYTLRDGEAATRSGDLWLGFGGYGNTADENVAGMVVEAASQAGLQANWNGRRDCRVCLTGVEKAWLQED